MLNVDDEMGAGLVTARYKSIGLDLSGDPSHRLPLSCSAGSKCSALSLHFGSSMSRLHFDDETTEQMQEQLEASMPRRESKISSDISFTELDSHGGKKFAR